MAPELRSLMLLAACFSARAQIFSQNNAGIRALESGAAVAADFDNDGNMDLLISGNDPIGTYTQVCRNLGGAFNTVALLPPPDGLSTAFGSVAAGDFYNTGRLDAFVTGIYGADRNGNPLYVSQLWHNLGNNGFSLMTNSGLLPSASSYGIGVGDFDNDGKLDIILTGVGFGGHASLTKNLGNGFFTNTTSGLMAGTGSLFVGDFDNDGYMDVLIGGTLWRNLGNGTFTNVSSGLPSNVTAIGDFDNDGYLDVLVGGIVWRNLGNGTFTNMGSGFPGDGLAVGDYDNDGNLDVLARAGDFYSPVVQVWRNLGGGNFTNIQTVAGNADGGYSWGDFYNHGRLDFFITGQNGNDSNGHPLLVSQLWGNDLNNHNSPPTAPMNLGAQILGRGGVKLSWGAATDDHTPASGLNYNIRVGSSPGGVEIVSPEADPVTGRRLVVDIGNAQERLFSLLTNLVGGTYYWSVQAIDTAFAGGAFAAESTFVIPPSITGFSFQTNGQFRASFTALGNSSYTLQASTNLQQWTNVTTLVAATNGAAQLTDANGAGFARRYYRLSVP